MNEYKIVLEKAFKEVETRELNLITEDAQEEWFYSTNFKRKMNKLIKSQRCGYWKFANTAGKRIAIIAVIIAISISCAIAVEASRKVIVKFFKNVFNTHTDIVSYVDEEYIDYVPQYIEQVYTIKQMPANFKRTYYYKDNLQVITEWTNSDNKCCSLYQYIVRSSQTYDTENTSISEVKINDCKVYTYTKNGYTNYIWSEKGYIFIFNINDEIDNNFVYSIIGNLAEIN